VQKEEKQANEHLFTTCSFETFSEALQSWENSLIMNVYLSLAVNNSCNQEICNAYYRVFADFTRGSLISVR
jgi:hypothetical protein